MAAADYRLCDVCDGKVFYDSNLNYETATRDRDGKWKYPENPFRVAGKIQPYGFALDRLGDWAVLCNECSKTHRCMIVPMESTK